MKRPNLDQFRKTKILLKVVYCLTAFHAHSVVQGHACGAISALASLTSALGEDMITQMILQLRRVVQCRTEQKSRLNREAETTIELALHALWVVCNTASARNAFVNQAKGWELIQVCLEIFKTNRHVCVTLCGLLQTLCYGSDELCRMSSASPRVLSLLLDQLRSCADAFTHSDTRTITSLLITLRTMANLPANARCIEDQGGVAGAFRVISLCLPTFAQNINLIENACLAIHSFYSRSCVHLSEYALALLFRLTRRLTEHYAANNTKDKEGAVEVEITSTVLYVVCHVLVIDHAKIATLVSGDYANQPGTSHTDDEPLEVILACLVSRDAAVSKNACMLISNLCCRDATISARAFELDAVARINMCMRMHKRNGLVVEHGFLTLNTLTNDPSNQEQHDVLDNMPRNAHGFARCHAQCNLVNAGDPTLLVWSNIILRAWCVHPPGRPSRTQSGPQSPQAYLEHALCSMRIQHSPEDVCGAQWHTFADPVSPRQQGRACHRVSCTRSCSRRHDGAYRKRSSPQSIC